MKLFLSFVFLIFVANSSFAHEDSVFIKIQSDTVQIWNTEVSANCASRFSLKTEITGNAIVVTECDTLGPLADCFCIYDLHSSLTGLTAGHYSVAVYRQEQKKYFYDFDTTIFIDSLNFTLGNTSSLSKNISFYQSACHTATSIDKEEAKPESFLLLSNYPNPFNPSTTIEFSVPQDGRATLKIYNTLGQLVATIFDGDVKAGYLQKAVFTASKLSNGIYFSRLTVDGSVRIRKMVVLK